jgi:hypothetical protein
MGVSKTTGVLLAFAALGGIRSQLFNFSSRASENLRIETAKVETLRPDPPGPLSAYHAERPGSGDCEACHVTPGEIAPANCLACHDEIATRIEEGRGFHKDKAEGCGTCHAEHQGPDANLVPLDPGDFDHGETGFVLEGGHARVKDCSPCHDGGAAVRRSVGRSYLLRDARCSACHVSPHPGRQEECLACHSMEGWRSSGDRR